MWKRTALIAVIIVIVYRTNRPILTDQRFAKQLSYWRRMCTVTELMHLAGNKPRVKI